MLQLMKIEWQKIKWPVIAVLGGLSAVTSMLSCTLYKDYALYYDLEAWEIGTEIFAMLYPLIVVVPLCWSLFYERRDYFLKYVIPRVEIKRYILSKWIVQAISSFCLIFIPWIISAIFALYVKPPIDAIELAEGYTGFEHVFQNLFVSAPLAYVLLLSAWKGIIGVFIMTLGFVFSMYIKNIFVILTGPFIYAILENFILAVLRLEKYRLVTAFEPACLSCDVITWHSFFVGPALLTIVIIGCWAWMAWIKKASVVEV